MKHTAAVREKDSCMDAKKRKYPGHLQHFAECAAGRNGMNQEYELNINPLPAKTWNWLHMNGTSVKSPAFLENGTVEQTVPSSVEYKAASENEADAVFSEIQTGMGAEIDGFLKNGDTELRVYTTKSQTTEKQPLVLNFTYGTDRHTANRLAFHLIPGSELTVLMDFSAETESDGTAAIQTKVYAEEGAVLHLVQVQRLATGFTFYNDIGTKCGKNARVETIQLVLGGKNTYLGSRTALEGESSALSSDVGYLVGANEHLDMNFVAYHTGKKTESRMDASGVLRENGFKLFRGTIDFRKGCAGAVGNEKEDVLLLDDAVVNQTIPLILCEEEDVEGNHGATIGKLDEELLFYLESRGMSEEAVYEMMARARIDAIAGKIPDTGMREKIRAYLGDVQDEEK